MINELEKEIENLKTLPYYQLFNRDAEQQKDIADAKAKLEKLRAQYSVSAAICSVIKWNTDNPAKAGQVRIRKMTAKFIRVKLRP